MVGKNGSINIVGATPLYPLKDGGDLSGRVKSDIFSNVLFRTSGTFSLATPILNIAHNLNNLINFANINSPSEGGFPLPWFYLKKEILTFQVPNLNEIVTLIKPDGLFICVRFRRNIAPLQLLFVAIQIYNLYLI